MRGGEVKEGHSQMRMLMDDLPAPSKDIAARILQEVDFEHRLAGGYLHEHAGVMMFWLYSVEEVFTLLNSPCPQINLGDLERWLREVIKDKDLADHIQWLTTQHPTLQKRLMAIRNALGLRLIQCRQICAA